MIPPQHDSLAHTAAVVTGVTATTWLTTANTIVQLIAGLVAIITGVYAIAHYRRKRKQND